MFRFANWRNVLSVQRILILLLLPHSRPPLRGGQAVGSMNALLVSPYHRVKHTDRACLRQQHAGKFECASGQELRKVTWSYTQQRPQTCAGKRPRATAVLWYRSGCASFSRELSLDRRATNWLDPSVQRRMSFAFVDELYFLRGQWLSAH